MYSNEANIYFKYDPLDFCLLSWPHAPLLHKEIYCWKVNIIQTSNRACSRITSSHLHIHYTENAPQRRCQITVEFILCHAQNVWATSNFLEILKLLSSEHVSQMFLETFSMETKIQNLSESVVCFQKWNNDADLTFPLCVHLTEICIPKYNKIYHVPI